MSNNGNGNGRINWAAKRKTKDIYIDEIEETITIRALSASQLDGLSDEDRSKTVTLMALSIVDKDLQRIYVTDEDMAELKEMSIAVRKQISDEIGLLNGFSKEAIDEAKKKSSVSLSTDSVSV